MREFEKQLTERGFNPANWDKIVIDIPYKDLNPPHIKAKREYNSLVQEFGIARVAGAIVGLILSLITLVFLTINPEYSMDWGTFSIAYICYTIWFMWGEVEEEGVITQFFSGMNYPFWISMAIFFYLVDKLKTI